MYITTNEKIESLASQIAADLGYELVDLTLSGRGRRVMLRVFIDKEGGVTLNDCESFSRHLETLLDVEDPIQGPYTLEVSSPGLDRPLRLPSDFMRNIGKLIRIVTREKIENQSFFVGKLLAVEGDVLRLSLSTTGKELLVPLNEVSRANLEIELK